MVCDSESRMLLEKTAKCNDVDLQQYEFYEQSLADGKLFVIMIKSDYVIN